MKQNILTPVQTINTKKVNSVAQKLEALNRITETVLREFESFTGKESDVFSKTKLNFYEEVKQFEIELISFALDKAHGNQKIAAKMLDLNATTLNSKIKRYGIRPQQDWDL